jgi:DNA-binding response OmpR family regulator
VLYPLSYGGPGRARRYQPRLGRRRGSGLPTLAARTVASRRMTSSLGRVLVVDDDDVIRQLITVNLELEGFEVATAVDGQDCLDKVKDVQPDVVTLDIMMPRLDGWEAAGRLRADPETAGVKVVLLSARAQEADLARGSRIGVDAYLTKPFDPDELIAVVRRLAGLPPA